VPTSNQFVHAGLSAAIRSQALNFSPTQQADLNLPVLSLSSRIECDGIFYSPLSADTRKSLPYCVLYSDGDVGWRSASEARLEHCAAQQLARLLSISSHDSLVGSHKIQQISQTHSSRPMLFRWSSRSFHEASTGLHRVEYCESASGLESTSYTFFRTGKLSQRTGAESAPSVSKSANVPQNAGINSAPAHDHIFRHFISSLNPDDPSVTWINAGALDFLSCLERNGRLFEL